MAEGDDWLKKISLKRHLFSLTEVARDPLKFEPFGLYADIARRKKLSIVDGETRMDFVECVGESIDTALASDTFIYGHLTQAMFEALVVSLGGVKLIKQEDSGGVYSNKPDLKVPDFRVILDDGSQLLVEVKNCHATDVPLEYDFSEEYIDALSEYADLNRCSLAIAIFWSRANFWTLIPASKIPSEDGTRKISLGEALKFNCMSRLGDLFIGTRPPLRILIRVDRTPPESANESGELTYLMKINKVEIYCGDKLITDKTDANIAYFMCRYGDWKEQQPLALMEGEILEGIEYRWEPEEEGDDTQEFRLFRPLSSMFANYYRERAFDDQGKPIRIKVDFPPGSLGTLVPEGHVGEQLPLWTFVLSPNFDPPELDSA